MKSPFISYETGARWLRDRLEKGRLNSAEAQHVRECVALCHARAENRPLSRLALNELMASRYRDLKKIARDRLIDEIEPLFREYYRTAQSGWAGGNNTFVIDVSPNPAASTNTYKEWSRNGKWSGTSSRYYINLCPDWRSRVLSVPGLATAGRMITTHAEQIESNLWKAAWLRQGRGRNISAVEGYIHLEGGRFYHGKTADTARKGSERRERTNALATAKSKFADELRQKEAADLVKEYGRVVVSRCHSIASGNCEDGTDQWIEIHLAGRTTARVSELLEIDDSPAVVSACRIAILRKCKPRRANAEICAV